MFSVTILVLLYVQSAYSIHTDFVNRFHEKFVVQCTKGFAVSLFGSDFIEGKTDRRWSINCGRKLPGKLNQQQFFWSNYVNDHHKILNFHCPPQSVLSGMIGTYSEEFKDRRYRFRCTHTFRYRKQDCFWTKHINKYNKPSYVSIMKSRHYYFDGMVSFYNKRRNDRHFR